MLLIDCMLGQENLVIVLKLFMILVAAWVCELITSALEIEYGAKETCWIRSVIPTYTSWIRSVIPTYTSWIRSVIHNSHLLDQVSHSNSHLLNQVGHPNSQQLDQVSHPKFTPAGSGQSS